MIVWLASYPRSGNTLARIALQHLFGIRSRDAYPVTDQSVEKIIGQLPPEMSLAEMAAAPEHCFVKTHEMPGEDQWPAIYLVRDGRDALVPYAHFVLYTQHGIPVGGNRELFLETLRDLITSTGHLGGWGPHALAWTRSTAPTRIVRFEDLAADPGKELGQALGVLGQRRLAERHVSQPSFRKLHTAVPWFFRKGKVGAWREEMPSEFQELSGSSSIIAKQWRRLVMLLPAVAAQQAK